MFQNKHSNSILNRVFGFFSSLLISLLFFGQIQPVFAEETKEYSIQGTDIQAEVSPSGSMDVIEQRVYSFTGDYRFAYQRIEKNPDQKTAPGRVEPYQIRIKGICEKDYCYRFVYPSEVNMTDRRANTPGTYTVIQDNNEVYVQWHFKAINEAKIFTIQYVVDNAVTLHSDIAEIYWQFIGNKWEVPQKYVTVNVNLPYGINDKDIVAWGHGELKGQVSIPNAQTVKFAVDKVRSGKMLEARILVPKMSFYDGAQGHFSKAQIEEQESSFIAETKKWLDRNSIFVNLQKFLVALAWIFGAQILFRYLFFEYQRIPKANQADRVWEPPSNLEPAIVELLVRRTRSLSTKSFTATALSLVQQKFVKIIRSDDKKGFFVKKYEYGFVKAKEPKKLTVLQQDVYDYLFDKAAKRRYFMVQRFN